MIDFNLPGLYERYKVTSFFINLCYTYPEFLNENTKIGAIYDSIPYCLWNGGRIFSKFQQASKADIIRTKQIFNEQFNLPIRLIFTNNQLTEEHLYNTFCNLVLELLDDPLNEIVVASDLLEQYIRETYPNYKIISSTTKCLVKPQDALKELSKEYYQVCLDYNLNHNYKFLESIPEKDKPKVELLVNAVCPSGCPWRRQHYEINSLATLAYQNNFNVDCDYHGNNTFNDYPNHISTQEIYEKFVPLGIQHFKLEGRTISENELLANYIYYMIKPEYQLKALSKM